jgi:hypothetical protein
MKINKETEFEIIKKEVILNQEEFIKHFNEKWEKMISAPDLYKVAKDENKGLIESLVKDFNNEWVVTSTRIIYDKDGFAKIIHDADSTVVKQKSSIVDVPLIQDKAEYSKELEKFLQVLFDTKDDYQEIASVLKRFNKNKTLYIWTPGKESRETKSVRAVMLGFDCGRFNVYCINWFDFNVGFSRGVSVESAKQTKTKNKGVDER